jgi:hypothetical protein
MPAIWGNIVCMKAKAAIGLLGSKPGKPGGGVGGSGVLMNEWGGALVDEESCCEEEKRPDIRALLEALLEREDLDAAPFP